MTRLSLFVPVAMLLLVAMPVVKADSLDEKIDRALTFAENQLEHHAQRSGPMRFTCYTDTDGQWIGRGLDGWCCGFSAGLMWMMYDHTGDEKWADYGRDWNDSIIGATHGNCDYCKHKQ